MLERIGKYEIRGLLGRGATGSVYLAADPFAQREVAVKVLDAGAAGPEEARRQHQFFQNEAALAGKLRHPHIVGILDAGVERANGADVRYLVMEYVEGRPLAEFCRPQALLARPRAIEIAYKCCKALEYASALGVVHRGIKPANILVRADLDIKLSGFGSPGYVSPEQIRGEEVDFRSAMFSLGAVLHHLLTGERPVAGAPHAPSALRSDAPAALDAIVARALGKGREARYASWEDFGAALGALLGLDGEGEAELSGAQKFNALRHLSFFARFSDVELWEVVRVARWRKHSAGAVLIREGGDNDHIFVLASGLAKVTQRGKLLNAVSPGECVGEMAYARRNGLPRSATVTAVEPSWAVGLRAAEIDTLPEGCRARFTDAFLSAMAERISMLGGRLHALLQEQKTCLV